MKGYNFNSRTDMWKWIILFCLIGVLLVGMVFTLIPMIKDKIGTDVDAELDVPADDKNEDKAAANAIAVTDIINHPQLMLYSVPADVDSRWTPDEVTINATVTGTGDFDNEIIWAFDLVNDNFSCSVSDFINYTIAADKQSVTIETRNNTMASAIKVTATSAVNSEASASCMIKFVYRPYLQVAQVNGTGSNYTINFNDNHLDFNVQGDLGDYFGTTKYLEVKISLGDSLKTLITENCNGTMQSVDYITADITPSSSLDFSFSVEDLFVGEGDSSALNNALFSNLAHIDSSVTVSCSYTTEYNGLYYGLGEFSFTATLTSEGLEKIDSGGTITDLELDKSEIIF